MSEKFRLDRKIRFRNTFYTKCINVIIDSIGPSIILRSILMVIVSLKSKLYEQLTMPLLCFASMPIMARNRMLAW